MRSFLGCRFNNLLLCTYGYIFLQFASRLWLNLWLYDANQLKIEHQSRVWRNLTSLTLAISQLVRNVKLPLTAHRHQSKRLCPTLDQAIGTELVSLAATMLGPRS